MNQRKCVSCGAPIKIGATKCEYCGMVYDPDYWLGTIRYVPLHKGRKRLRTRQEIDDWLLDKGASKDAIAAHIRHNMAHQLADGLAEMMTVRMQHDPMRMVTIIDGEVWVEEPDRSYGW